MEILRRAAAKVADFITGDDVKKAVIGPAVEKALADAPDPDITGGKRWLVRHIGLNRKERRRLERKLKGLHPTAFDRRKVITERLKATPDNFPVRRVDVQGRKTYLFEPEYRELVDRTNKWIAAGRPDVKTFLAQLEAEKKAA